jgi:hypothetical protein
MEKLDYRRKCRDEVYKIRRSFSEFARYRSIKEHAELNGLNAQQFSRWDNGQVIPSLGEFIKWRQAAGMMTNPNCLEIASRAQKLDLATYLMICDTLNVKAFEF